MNESIEELLYMALLDTLRRVATLTEKCSKQVRDRDRRKSACTITALAAEAATLEGAFDDWNEIASGNSSAK